MTASRKRSRTCNNEDGCEFTPISKRINNLHIRSNLLTGDSESVEDRGNREEGCSHWTPIESDASHDAPNTNGVYNQQLPNGHHSVTHSLLTNGYTEEAGVAGCEHGQNVHLVHQQNAIHIPNNTSHFQDPHGQLLQDGFLNNMQFPSDFVFPYQPELDEHSNPIYYRINGLLYDLHVSRLQRNNQ